VADVERSASKGTGTGAQDEGDGLVPAGVPLFEFFSVDFDGVGEDGFGSFAAPSPDVDDDDEDSLPSPPEPEPSDPAAAGVDDSVSFFFGPPLRLSVL
jgi:hypothetical protein